MKVYKVKGNEGWEVIIAKDFGEAEAEYKRIMEDIYETGTQYILKIHLLGEAANLSEDINKLTERQKQ